MKVCNLSDQSWEKEFAELGPGDPFVDAHGLWVKTREETAVNLQTGRVINPPLWKVFKIPSECKVTFKI